MPAKMKQIHGRQIEDHTVTSQQTDESVAIESGPFICPSAVLPSDVVYLMDDNKIDLADNSNSVTGDVLGVVISKPTSVTAFVRSRGPTNLFSGLTPTQKYFMGSSGALISTPPSNGVIQRVGKALTATTLYIDIQPRIL